MSDEASLLIPFEVYEENAANIGTQQKSAHMGRFIDKVREGLYLLDGNATDSRIRMIANMINNMIPVESWSSPQGNMDRDLQGYSPKQSVHYLLLVDSSQDTNKPGTSNI